MQSRLLLDVVVRKSATILELLTSKDQTLLVGGDTLLVCSGMLVLLVGVGGCVDGLSHTLNLGLDVVDGVRRLHLEGDSLPR